MLILVILTSQYLLLKNLCQSCNFQNFQADFDGDPQVGKFLQEYQSKVNDLRQALVWISYKQFTNINYLAEGGFGKVYKARWKNKGKNVALKELNNSQAITKDFLR